jgi:N utilization substance protein A
VDILTQEEFTKGMETMYATIQTIAGITEQHADKLAAMGMVSVFDIEEVGADVLISELGIDEATAATVVETCSTKAKEVAEQQAKDKEEKERKAREEAERVAATGEALSAGDAAADAILGGGGGGNPASDAGAEDRAKDILGQS